MNPLQSSDEIQKATDRDKALPSQQRLEDRGTNRKRAPTITLLESWMWKTPRGL